MHRPQRFARLATSFLAAALLTACGGNDDSGSGNSAFATLDGNAPLVVAHRGASGYYPEENAGGLHARRRHGRRRDRGPTSSSPRTASSSLVTTSTLATSTDVAAHPEFCQPQARRRERRRRGRGRRLVRRRLHARGDQDAGRHLAQPCPRQALRRPVQGGDVAGGPRPHQAEGAAERPHRRRVPGDEETRRTTWRSSRPARFRHAWRTRWWPSSTPTA